MTVNQDQIHAAVIVDAQGLIVGRLSSAVAKLLLQGKRVTVINAGKALLSGNRRSILGDFFARLKIASIVHPRNSPIHYRTPEGILKKTIRGMLPRTKPSGLEAFRRLRVHTNVPIDLSSEGRMIIETAKPKRPLVTYLSLAEVSSMIGRN